jgi:hypothetical protein
MSKSRSENNHIFWILSFTALFLFIFPIAFVGTLFSDYSGEINKFDRSIHLPKNVKIIDHKTSLSTSGNAGLNFNVFYTLKTTDKKELVSYLEIFSNPKWESDANFINYELTESDNGELKLHIYLLRSKEWYEPDPITSK